MRAPMHYPCCIIVNNFLFRTFESFTTAFFHRANKEWTRLYSVDFCPIPLESTAAWCVGGTTLSHSELIYIQVHRGKRKNVSRCSRGLRSWSQWCRAAVSLPSPLMGGRRLLCVGVCLSVCLLPVTQADRSDCGPDGPWCGWLDQVERYQTTHSDWHKPRGLSVLGGGGSGGTGETLQSNKPIRRETDTPVRNRVTEAEGREREEDEEDRRRSGGCSAPEERRGGERDKEDREAQLQRVRLEMSPG